MRQLTILLSFDHELSLGGCTSYERNLFAPTSRLLQLAAELGVGVTLFSDVLCALKFREWDGTGFYRRFAAQIDDVICHGQDVQLHLHPHWLDSTYINGKYIPSESYTLGAFRDRSPPDDIPGIVRRGIETIHELCCRDPAYQCIAFRAGGYAIEPESGRVLSGLYENGIRIDSTVAKGFRFECDLWSVDFRQMPRSANWYIAPTGPIDREAANGIFEIPIATRPRTPFNNLPRLMRRIVLRGRGYDSTGWAIDVGRTSAITKLLRLVPRSCWMLGFDDHTETPRELLKTLLSHVDRHGDQSHIACSAISHPKFMGERSLTLMRDFVGLVREEFGTAVSFPTFRQFYDMHLKDKGKLDPMFVLTNP